MNQKLRERIWNWLPTFLAIAESGSAVAASRSLHLTPAAVSRTLRLLEETLGEPVFNRVGRSLVLNSRGSSLRAALRVAVTTVDRGLSQTLADPFAGALRVASLGVLAEKLVVPSLISLKRKYPRLVPEHLNLRTADATYMLARGEIDLAFYYEELAVDGLVVEHLGDTPMSVYCGEGHPLFGAKRISASQVLEHEFSIPQVGDSGLVMDGWPTDVARRVGMRITTLQSNLQICRSGLLLTVLPDISARDSLEAGELRKLPTRDLPAIEVFSARSASSLEGGASATLVRQVRERLVAVNKALRRRIRRPS